MTDARTLTCKAIIFDMDGTIVDSTAVVEAIWGVFADQFGLDVSEVLRTAHGRQTEDTVSTYAPVGTDVQRVSDELTVLEVSTVEGIVAIPGAPEFVHSLPHDRVGLVTSATKALLDVRMTAAGIEIPAIIVPSDEIARGKPAPDCYLEGARRFGLDPSDIVVFEDAEAGVAAAVAAGAQTVVVGTNASPITEGLNRIPDFRGVSAVLVEAADGSREIVISLGP